MSDDILFEIQRSLGRIEQKIDGNAAALTQHVADDKAVAKALFERIEPLQLAGAKQRGFMSALTLVGTAVGAAIGHFIGRH